MSNVGNAQNTSTTPETTPAATPIVTNVQSVNKTLTDLEPKFPVLVGAISTLLKPDISSSALNRKQVQLAQLRTWMSGKNYPQISGKVSGKYLVTITGLITQFSSKSDEKISLSLDNLPAFCDAYEEYIANVRKLEVFFFPRNGENSKGIAQEPDFTDF